MKAIATAQLAHDYAAGAGLKTLAARYPLCRSAILYRLRKAGVPMRVNGAPLGNQNVKGRITMHAATTPPDDGPGDDCPDHGPYGDDECPKC